MTTMELTEPAGRVLFDACGGESTLDDLVVGAWEGLAAARTVACPICDGKMLPRGVRDGQLSGECSACGTTLA